MACDSRGLTADERMDRMMALYHILIEKAPPVFPPPGLKTSEGFNFNLIEDILCGIQARLCLYLICQFTGYAARAFSSIDVENAHSILNHLLKTGAQTCTIEEMTWLISTLMRMQILSKTEIGRSMLKPSSTIYRTPELGEGFSDILVSGSFDLSLPSRASKEDRPYRRHMAPRKQVGVRSHGWKSGESSFY